jgi:zinc protease
MGFLGRSSFLLIALLILLSGGARSWGQSKPKTPPPSDPEAKSPPIRVVSYMLKNGLKLLIHEDHSVPTVVTYIFYRIGSRNEGPGRTGLSHFFEHMMFNGAKKYGPNNSIG